MNKRKPIVSLREAFCEIEMSKLKAWFKKSSLGEFHYLFLKNE